MMCAALGNHAAVVTALLKRPGLEVEAVDTQQRRTALLHAAAGGLGTEAIEALVTVGHADALARDKMQRTALMLAALAETRGKATAVLTLLHRLGCSPNATDGSGLTALGLACRAGNVVAIEPLLKLTSARDIVAHTDARGMTPLMHAAASGHGAVVRLLLDLQAFATSSQDADGRTALDHAEAQGFKEVAVMLVRA